MTKDELAARLNKAGLAEALRVSHRDGEIFVAEGFFRDPPPNLDGVARLKWLAEHPSGYYQTVWFWAKGEDHVQLGPVLVFDALHDIERLPLADRQRARLNRAVREAQGFLASRQRAFEKAGSVHG